MAHVAGSVITPADVLSRPAPKVIDKIRLNVRKDTQPTPIEVTTFSSDITDEEQFFFTQSDIENKPDEQTLQRKYNQGKTQRNG